MFGCIVGMKNNHFIQKKRGPATWAALLLFYLLIKKTEATNTHCINPKTVFIPISQSQNLYTQSHLPIANIECSSYALSMTYRFQEAHNGKNIATSLFQYNPLVFSGESYDGSSRPQNALIPEYFGLSPDTNASFSLNPKIRNQIIDIQFYGQVDNYWFQTNIPLVKAQWKATNQPITNNLFVGKEPLQNDASVYIYNIGQKLNELPTPLPPEGTCGETINFYDILPIPNDLNEKNLSNKDYTGAYIVSSKHISENKNQATPLQVTDQNTGAKHFSEELKAEGLATTDELNQRNWKIGIGTWQTPTYIGANYIPPCKNTEGQITASTIEESGPISLSSNIEDTSTNSEGTNQNILEIKQPSQPSARSFIEAMSGTLTFNNTISRAYGNLNFDQDVNTESWQIADILLWVGYDAFCDEKKHIGAYLKMVIPTGTIIDKNWLQYALNPVIGNGRHVEFGGGISGHYDCCRKNSILRAKIDGYLTHVFANNQTRLFDKNNLTMSRYAILKKLKFTGNAESNALNDNYDVLGLTYLGNENTGELRISHNIRSEAIAEISLLCQCFSASIGYAFSGLTADKIDSCQTIVNNTNPNQEGSISYGFKGNAPMSTLVVTNINAQNEVFTPNNSGPVDGITKDNYPLASLYQPDQNTNLITDIGVKSSADVTIGGNSGAYIYGNTTNQQEVAEGDDPSTVYTGPTENDLFSLPDITQENRSGLMEGQLLNRIFGKIEYSWDSQFQPTVGILGSYGFTTKKYLSASYWDLGLYVGCTF
jgi:hypothetical protein